MGFDAAHQALSAAAPSSLALKIVPFSPDRLPNSISAVLPMPAADVMLPYLQRLAG